MDIKQNISKEKGVEHSDSRSSIAKIEEDVLAFWDQEKIMEKVLDRPGPLFSFFDGPPFATGLPHYGHILATTIKDTVLRYWTMQGFQTPRRVGWDCHGLPVENLIEKELGIKSKKEIEELGVDKFNQACRDSVLRCTSEFEKTLTRVGRWADYSDPYTTMSRGYIESVWWVLKQLWDDGLVYEDYRVAPYCPRCGTTISNFEVNQGYKEANDPSVFVLFDKFLIWTTTPWTLPANQALAVNPEIEYCLVENEGREMILAEKRLEVLEGEYTVKEKFLGQDLVGQEYSGGRKVVPADYVSTEDGTGIVHIAPMYGEEDFKLGQKHNLKLEHTVNEEGCYNGKFIKDADKDIINELKEEGRLYKQGRVVHTYPFCWRCNSPLIYYALKSWYIKVTAIKDKLIENNQKIHWVPGHLKDGRFGKWLEEVKDWSFSRSRFWGAPLPIWRCEKCQQTKCLGSADGIEVDLHRPSIDEVTFQCSCGGQMKRVPEVFDCWFESGSMPYAQWHYPAKNKEIAEERFPADFIAEGIDQTRGWFYTLHVLATALTNKDRGLGVGKPAFRNVITNGLILSETGKKLSKSLRNYTAPEKIIDQYGADSLRFFLLSSSTMGEDYRFADKAVGDTYRRVVMTLFNSLSFWQIYRQPAVEVEIKNSLNKWILSRLSFTNEKISSYMQEYDLTRASRTLADFIDDLSNWYIRRARRRFKDQEAVEFSEVLRRVLLDTARISAPFLPFLSEHIFKTIQETSVHLEKWPEAMERDKQLEKEMTEVREMTAQVLAQRSEHKIKVRQPLNQLKIPRPAFSDELTEILLEEVNVKKIIADAGVLALDTEITEELRIEGEVREIIRRVQAKRKEQKLSVHDLAKIKIVSPLADKLQSFYEEIKKETQAEELTLLEGEEDINVSL